MNYTLLVDTQVEDTGTYSCWIVHQSGHSLYPILGQFDVSINGPLVLRDFYYEVGKNITSVSDGVLIFELLDASLQGKFTFEAEASSVPLKWDVFIGNKTHQRKSNITKYFEISSPDNVNITESGLVKTQHHLL